MKFLASIVLAALLRQGLCVPPCEGYHSIDSEYVADTENRAEPHLRPSCEESRQGQVELMGWRQEERFQDVEPEEVKDHQSYRKFSYEVEDIEVLDDLEVGYEDDW